MKFILKLDFKCLNCMCRHDEFFVCVYISLMQFISTFVFCCSLLISSFSFGSFVIAFCSLVFFLFLGSFILVSVYFRIL